MKYHNITGSREEQAESANILVGMLQQVREFAAEEGPTFLFAGALLDQLKPIVTELGEVEGFGIMRSRRRFDGDIQEGMAFAQLTFAIREAQRNCRASGTYLKFLDRAHKLATEAAEGYNEYDDDEGDDVAHEAAAPYPYVTAEEVSKQREEHVLSDEIDEQLAAELALLLSYLCGMLAKDSPLGLAMKQMRLEIDDVWAPDFSRVTKASAQALPTDRLKAMTTRQIFLHLEDTLHGMLPRTQEEDTLCLFIEGFLGTLTYFGGGFDHSL